MQNSEINFREDNMSVTYSVNGLIAYKTTDVLKKLVESNKLNGYKISENIPENKTEITLHGVSVNFVANLYEQSKSNR